MLSSYILFFCCSSPFDFVVMIFMVYIAIVKRVVLIAVDALWNYCYCYYHYTFPLRRTSVWPYCQGRCLAIARMIAPTQRMPPGLLRLASALNCGTDVNHFEWRFIIDGGPSY